MLWCSLLNSILFFMHFAIINKFPFLFKYVIVVISRNTTYLKYADGRLFKNSYYWKYKSWLSISTWSRKAQGGIANELPAKSLIVAIIVSHPSRRCRVSVATANISRPRKYCCITPEITAEFYARGERFFMPCRVPYWRRGYRPP